MEWVDRELTIGDVVLKVVRRTKRCAATGVDPQTGIRDLNIPVSLLKYVKHGDLGIYAEVSGQSQHYGQPGSPGFAGD